MIPSNKIIQVFCFLTLLTCTLLAFATSTGCSRSSSPLRTDDATSDATVANIPREDRLDEIVVGEVQPLPAPAREPNDLESLIIGLLQEQDKDIRSLAFEQIRGDQASGEEATVIFAAELPKLGPDAQSLLVSALAERGDPAALPLLRNLIGAADQEAMVRQTAITALGTLGNADDVPQLVQLLLGGASEEQAAARTSLTRLSGPAVNQALVDLLDYLSVASRIRLIEILRDRRAKEAIPTMLTIAIGSNPELRVAAMKLLGELAGTEHLPAMVSGVLQARAGRERVGAERAVAAVCQRASEAGDQAAPLIAAVQARTEAEQLVLLPALGRVGGEATLSLIEKAISATEAKAHDAGIRALCNWPNASVAPRLIKLAKSDPDPGHQKMAQRALIRVAPLPDGRDDAERLALTKDVFAMCQTDALRKLVLQRTSAIRNIESLRYLLPYLDNASLSEAACLSVVELAHHRGLRDSHKSEFDAALDKVIATSQDAIVVERAQRYQKGQTWVRPDR